jgi:aldehyde:ferredoxin oxidoreductase
MTYGGFTGKILRVDLSSGDIKTLNTFDYVPDFIGGIGIGYRILWDETNENTTEWSPENCLIFNAPPVCGTPAPSSGRSELVGFAPQSYPKPWAAHSGMGGDFGPKLKFAGYDAIVIIGKSDSPKYLFVSEESVQIENADYLWGMASYSAQDSLTTRYGEDASVICIGPAGENLVRWATIESKTENVFGQGGFGAVMGDKKLKAIVVKPGNHRINIANPDALIKEVTKVNKAISPVRVLSFPTLTDHKRFTQRRVSPSWGSCTAGSLNDGQAPTCPQSYYSKVPLKYTGFGSVSTSMHCIGGACGKMFDVAQNTEVAIEANHLTDQLGLNQWELATNIYFFLSKCVKAGKISKIMGDPITEKMMSSDTAIKWFKAVAYREGEGDLWAEGACRAADALNLTSIATTTHKHGYGPHWDGRHQQLIHYPVWVVSAMLWALTGKDPYNSAHGYVRFYPTFVKEWAPSGIGSGKDGALSRDGQSVLPYRQFLEPGAKIYGAQYANHGWDEPELGYVDKEYVVRWHVFRSIMLCSIPACDFTFPILYDPNKSDMVGYIDAELNMYNAVVGTEWTLDDMHEACERVSNLERAIQVRQGRTRATDESVIPYFEEPSNWPKEPQNLDVNQFSDLLDRYYNLRGWDKNSGIPKRDTLERCGLKNIADELSKLGKLP